MLLYAQRPEMPAFPVTPGKVFIIKDRGKPGLPGEIQYRTQLQDQIDEQDKIIGREYPEYPAYIEVLKADSAVFLLLLHQKGRDQKTADHKEDVDTKTSVAKNGKRERNF